MNWKRAFLGLGLLATIAWFAFVATRFELVRIGAVPAPLFLATAIGVPAVLWGLGLLAVWAARGFGSRKSDGSN